MMPANVRRAVATAGVSLVLAVTMVVAGPVGQAAAAGPVDVLINVDKGLDKGLDAVIGKSAPAKAIRWLIPGKGWLKALSLGVMGYSLINGMGTPDMEKEAPNKIGDDYADWYAAQPKPPTIVNQQPNAGDGQYCRYSMEGGTPGKDAAGFSVIPLTRTTVWNHAQQTLTQCGSNWPMGNETVYVVYCVNTVTGRKFKTGGNMGSGTLENSPTAGTNNYGAVKQCVKPSGGGFLAENGQNTNVIGYEVLDDPLCTAGSAVCSANLTADKRPSASSNSVSYTNEIVWGNVSGKLDDALTIRQFRTEITCRSASGGTAVVVGESVPVVDGTNVKQAGIPDPKCPAGHIPVSGRVLTGFGPDDMTVSDAWDLDPAAVAAYPLCIGVGSNGCVKRVELDGQVCNYDRPDCHTWYETIWNATPARIQCQWGPYTLEGQDCFDLAHAYKTPTGLLVEDDSPLPSPLMIPTRDPLRPLQPAPVPMGPDRQPLPVPYVYPVPEPQPTATATPGATGTASPTGTAAPTAPGTAAPQPTPTIIVTMPPMPGGTPVPVPTPTDTPDGDACFPSGWGVLNPVEWVYKPVKCALVWAFVPPPGAATSAFSGLVTAWQTSSPGLFIGGIGNVMTSMQVSKSGCQGPPLSFDTTLSGAQTLYPLNACDEPVATVATIINTCLKLAIWVGCFVACANIVLRSVGMRFATFLHSGKDDE